MLLIGVVGVLVEVKVFDFPKSYCGPPSNSPPYLDPDLARAGKYVITRLLPNFTRSHSHPSLDRQWSCRFQPN